MSYKKHDNPLYFWAANKAAQTERTGDYRRAAAIWIKACRLSHNNANQRWSEYRANFCLMQTGREKLTEKTADEL